MNSVEARPELERCHKFLRHYYPADQPDHCPPEDVAVPPNSYCVTHSPEPAVSRSSGPLRNPHILAIM